MAPKPSVWIPVRVSRTVSTMSVGVAERWVKIPYRIIAAWEMKNRTKIGVRAATDSLTPRRLSRTSPTATIRMNWSLKRKSQGGRKLRRASTPLAMEMPMVSM